MFTATLTIHSILYYTAHFIARRPDPASGLPSSGQLAMAVFILLQPLLEVGYCFIQYIDLEQEAHPTMQPRGDKDNGQVSQRLWRKINSKPNVEDEKSTQKSLVKTFKSDAIMDSAPCEALPSEVKEEPDITEFLMQIHHKMSNIDHDSESEIMERLSLEWPESANRSQSIIDRRSIFSQESSLLNQGWKTERDIGSQASALKGIKNLHELQAYLSGINPLISDELGELMKENQKLVEECNSCKYNDKKTLLKIQLLNNQIHMLEKKNEELTADGERLRHELDCERVKQAHKTLEGKKGESGGGEGEKGQHNEKEQSGLKLSSSLDLNELRSPPGLQRTDSVASSQSSSPNLGNHDYQSIVAQIFRPAKRTRPVKQG